jgi:glyoxylase-like metal-dependent hydrolase (beta-lactamase superfamily II)
MDRVVNCPYRIRLGELELVIVSDGPLNVGQVSDVLVRDPGGRAAQFQNKEMVLAQNALALHAPTGWIVFETGVNSIEGHADAGKLARGLAAAGIAAADVCALLPTHAHLDHVGGIMNREGERNFPNAVIHLSEAELGYWLDDARLGGTSERSGRVARANLMPNLDRILVHRDGGEPVPGIHAIHTVGHTVGHTSFLIGLGEDRLLIAGDLAHHEAQIEDVLICTRFDADRELASASRLRTLDFLAATRTLALFYHFAWPGLGYVEKRGRGFRFVPVAAPG